MNKIKKQSYKISPQIQGEFEALGHQFNGIQASLESNARHYDDLWKSLSKLLKIDPDKEVWRYNAKTREIEFVRPRFIEQK